MLAQLAEKGGERRREMPRDAEHMAEEERRRRLERVFELQHNNASGFGLLALLLWTMLVPLCGAITAQDGNPAPAIMGVLAAVAATVWGIAASGQRREQRRASVAERLSWAGKQPFPVRGYEVWCLSERPLLDVTLSAPVDHRQLADAVAAVDSTVELEWLDERTARLFIPPRTVTASEEPTHWYADPAALARLVDRLLVPLHTDVPIERMDMGGTMHKR